MDVPINTVNYDATNTDDGSCLYTCTDNSVYVSVVTDYYGSEMTWDVTDAGASLLVQEVLIH